MTPAAALRIVKFVHTPAVAVFAGCIFAILVLAWAGEFRLVLIAAALVVGETVALVLNGWRCPLTGVAARYADDRRDNFDIYLPAWLARHNKSFSAGCSSPRCFSLLCAGCIGRSEANRCGITSQARRRQTHSPEYRPRLSIRRRRL
jgi:hypothetical protein